MKKDGNLSDEVQAFIASLDMDWKFGATPEERKQNEEAQKVIDFIVDDLVSSRESLTISKLATIDKLVKSAPELIESFLDDRFTRDAANAVPGYVRRIMQLSRVEGTSTPSRITNGYMQEAVRTYILGLPQASIALSRAALEQAIKEKLGLQLSREFRTFQDLLKEARKWNILDDIMEKCAREVANAGDDVLHDRPADLRKALEVLDKLRGLFRHIYSSEGHY